VVNIWTTGLKKNGVFLVRIRPFLNFFFSVFGTPHFGTHLGGSGGGQGVKNAVKKVKKNSSAAEKKSAEALNSKKKSMGALNFLFYCIEFIKVYRIFFCKKKIL